MTRHQTVEDVVERDGEDLPVLLEINWCYDPGEFIEPGHSRNGYGRGWKCDMTAHTDNGKCVELTDGEIETFEQRYPL